MSEVWHRYQCEYNHGGQTWGCEISATSHEDAQRRLRSLGLNGQVMGRIALKVPLRAPASWRGIVLSSLMTAALLLGLWALT